jgi:hypothetical protein
MSLMPTERQMAESTKRALESQKDLNGDLIEELARVERQLAMAESTRDSAQAASTRDLLDARNMRRIVNAPPMEAKALADVSHERRLQNARFGDIAGRYASVPMGTGDEQWKRISELAKNDCDAAFAKGEGTWGHVLHEEFCEAMAESDPVRLRAELVQCAAVACFMIEALDRIAAGEKP